MIKSLVSISKFIEKKFKYNFFLLVILSFITAVFEIISIGTIIPFISLITNPENEYALFIKDLIKISYFSGLDEVLILGFLFILFVIIGGLLKLSLLYFTIQLSNSVSAQLGTLIFSKNLHRTYIDHISQGSNEIISGITQKITDVAKILISFSTITTSLIISIIIFSSLLLINASFTIAGSLTITLIYMVIAFTSKKLLVQNSLKISNEQNNIVRFLQEGIGSFRDLLLNKLQNFYVNKYYKSINIAQKASGDNIFIGQSPRIFLETVLLSIIIIVILILNNKSDFSQHIPLVAAFALAIQRLLPLIQQIYNNWTLIAGRKGSILEINEFLTKKISKQFIEGSKKISFQKTIKFCNVKFNYPNTKNDIFSDLNLTINYGEVVGIIGESGSGKSTLVDLLSGLISPNSGEIKIDEEVLNDKNLSSWQDNISYVPQNIFLLNGSVYENIAFGVDNLKIDKNKVETICSNLNLTDLIDKLPNKYDERIGENAIKLSGGQKQRIAIARALYRNSKIIIFDESTSALDQQSEEKVLNTIYGINTKINIFIISHRVSTLNKCNSIIKINKNKTVERISN